MANKRKTAKTITSKHGKDFYARIGAKGGRKSRGGGFAYLKEHDPERLRELGAKGGKKSKRTVCKFVNKEMIHADNCRCDVLYEEETGEK